MSEGWDSGESGDDTDYNSNVKQNENNNPIQTNLSPSSSYPYRCSKCDTSYLKNTYLLVEDYHIWVFFENDNLLHQLLLQMVTFQKPIYVFPIIKSDKFYILGDILYLCLFCCDGLIIVDISNNDFHTYLQMFFNDSTILKHGPNICRLIVQLYIQYHVHLNGAVNIPLDQSWMIFNSIWNCLCWLSNILVYAKLLPSIIPDTPSIYIYNIDNIWFDKVHNWMQLFLLSFEEQQSKIVPVYFDSCKYDSIEKTLTLLTSQYKFRIRLKSTVWCRMKNNDIVKCFVNKIEGKTVILKLPADFNEHYRISDIIAVELSRKTETDAVASLFWDYIKNYLTTQGEYYKQNNLLNLIKDDLVEGENFITSCPYSSIKSFLSQYNSFNNLNESQQSCIVTCFSNIPGIVAVQGPPGTGKTKTIGVFVSLCLNINNYSFLIMGHTNTCCLNLLKTLKQYFSPEILGIIVSQEYYEDWHEDLYEHHQEYMVSKKSITQYKIIICTLGSALMGQSQDILPHFQILIIDEGSQILDIESILLLSKNQHFLSLFCFGDVNQLPPYISGKPEDSEYTSSNSILSVISYRVSIPNVLLNIQYRMPYQIGSMISSLFYDNQISSFQQDKFQCIFWHDLCEPHSQEGSSCYNLSEIKYCEELYTNLSKNFSQIIFLTFYESQRNRLVQKKLPAYNIISYQGQEAEVIVVCCTRCCPSIFLCNRFRVNVALSRSKKQLHIIGCQTHMQQSDLWVEIINYINKCIL